VNPLLTLASSLRQTTKNNQMPVSQNIEYKQSWRDEHFKWICGFATALSLHHRPNLKANKMTNERLHNKQTLNQHTL
jgi:hypothetical protein